MSDDDRVAKGRELAARLLAGAPQGRRLPPEFLRQTMGNVFGDVWQGEDLELQQRSLVTCTVLVPTDVFGAPQLVATATSATIALVLALVVAVTRVRSVAHAFVPWKTALRVGLCIALASFVGRIAPVLPKPVTIVAAAFVGVAYLVALVVLRELGKEDLSLLLSIARRRKT